MRIIAHRGLPEGIDGAGSNTIADYERAFQRGLDVEMDVRFHGKRVLCSHDPIDETTKPFEPDLLLPTFEDFCHELRAHPGCRAFVNVKCDGMTPYIREIAVQFGVLDRIVTFDHSMPDFLHAEKHHPDVARCTRASPFEWGLGVKQKPGRWVWLDPISMPPEKMVRFLITRIKAYHTMNETSKVVVVSPDVHLKADTDKINMPGFAWEVARLPVYGVLTDRPTNFGAKP